MCLPGTVETVREGIEAERASAPRKGLTRRATLAGAGAATLGALLPDGRGRTSTAGASQSATRT